MSERDDELELPDPEPGTLLYNIARMVDNAEIPDNVSDAVTLRASRQFMRDATVFVTARQNIPQVSLSLCSAEMKLMVMALNITALLVAVNTPDRSKASREFSETALAELMDDIVPNDDHPFHDMVIVGCIVGMLRTAIENTPEVES